MRIALCDDNLGQLRILADAASNCGLWRGKDLSVDTFASGANLLDSVKSGTRYEYIFLDIEMPGMSGFDVCSELHPLCDAPIVFVSTHIELLPEAFAYRPHGFLAKPYDQGAFDRTVRSVIEQVSGGQFFHYTKDGRKEAADCKTILYFRISNYTLAMHLINGTTIILPRTWASE